VLLCCCCCCCCCGYSCSAQVDEETDRPTDPPVITGVEVLWNPFEDIVPRTTAAERRAQEQFK
jgi:peptidyl-prolyl cis-trans isomerase SDCCAG10